MLFALLDGVTIQREINIIGLNGKCSEEAKRKFFLVVLFEASTRWREGCNESSLFVAVSKSGLPGQKTMSSQSLYAMVTNKYEVRKRCRGIEIEYHAHVSSQLVNLLV